MNRILAGIMVAAIVAAAVTAGAQSRITDVSYPLRVHTNTLQVYYPTQAKFMASNKVVQTDGAYTFASNQTFGAGVTIAGAAAMRSTVTLGTNATAMTALSYGTATLVANSCVITNAAFRPLTKVVFSRLDGGWTGYPVATFVTNMMTVTSSVTNDWTNATVYIAITP